MSYLEVQQTNRKFILTVASNRNKNTFSGQDNFYVASSLIFPIIAFVLFAITRTIQFNSRSSKSKENAKF